MQSKIIAVALSVAAFGGAASCDDSETGAVRDFAIVAPRVGDYVHELRPIISVTPEPGAENYIIEIAPEPTFFDRNTISYAASNEGLDTVPVDGAMQRLRFAGINAKYQRYADRQPEPSSWKVSYNLTAMLGAPYGFRVHPCRDWLRQFAGVVVEGHEDPLRALTEFVSFSIMNEGSGSGYYNAYETLSRDMGVCGNTAELLTAFSATQGYDTKILSLKAPDQGHVVASTKGPDGRWRLLDGLYNIMVDGDEKSLIARVAEDPDFLNIDAFDGVAVPYRHFFQSADYAYETETSFDGIRFTDEEIPEGTVTFENLRFTCSPFMAERIAVQGQRVISNTFFVRASYYKDGQWSSWAYSYFNFLPVPGEHQRVRNNAENVWRYGALAPVEFIGGRPETFSGGTSFGSTPEQGYTVDFAIAEDGLAWVSPWAEGERQKRVGYDLGDGRAQTANGVFIRWVTPQATPTRFRIMGSVDGASWETVLEAETSYPASDPNYLIDYFRFPEAATYRAWSLVVDREASADAVAVDGLTLTAPL